MNRTLFAFKHFLLSLFIFLIIASGSLLLWYPLPYFTAAGGWQGLQIAAPIDLVLGPLLTLIVVNKNKEKSKIIFDLVVISMIQLSALGWGISTIYQQRPVANVYWDWEKAFFSVSAADLKKYGFELNELNRFGQQKPVFIIAKKPETKKEIKSVADKITNEAIPPYLQTNLYDSLAKNFDQIKSAQIDVNELLKSEIKAEQILNEIIEEFGISKDDFLIIPLFAKYQDLGAVFDQEGEYITIIVLRNK